MKTPPIFGPKNGNLAVTLPVTFAEAALGADIKVPTLNGEEVTVRLSPGTPNGRVLRIKGRGVHNATGSGDLLVTVEVQVPRRLDARAHTALVEFAAATSEEDVRAEFNSKAKA